MVEGCSLRGGRHRKGHKGGKSRKGRKMRGGVVSGAIGPLAVGAMEYGAVDISAPRTPSGGYPTDPYATGGTASVITGGKRRKTRKGGKSRKSKKGGKKSRKMKGGSWNPGAVNVSGAGYGFAGGTPGVTGGIAPAAGYQSGVGGAPMGGDGVRTA